jgi:hypothetical protein
VSLVRRISGIYPIGGLGKKPQFLQEIIKGGDLENTALGVAKLALDRWSQIPSHVACGMREVAKPRV